MAAEIVPLWEVGGFCCWIEEEESRIELVEEANKWRLALRLARLVGGTPAGEEGYWLHRLHYLPLPAPPTRLLSFSGNNRPIYDTKNMKRKQ